MVIVLTTVVVKRVEMLEELFGGWCTKLERLIVIAPSPDKISFSL
jgi:hypothetical protein